MRHTHACTHMQKYVCMHTHADAQTSCVHKSCTHMCAGACTHPCSQMYVLMCTYMCAHMSLCTHTHKPSKQRTNMVLGAWAMLLTQVDSIRTRAPLYSSDLTLSSFLKPLGQGHHGGHAPGMETVPESPSQHILPQQFINIRVEVEDMLTPKDTPASQPRYWSLLLQPQSNESQTVFRKDGGLMLVQTDIRTSVHTAHEAHTCSHSRHLETLPKGQAPPRQKAQ